MTANKFYALTGLSTIALILIGFLFYGPSGHDDSHITYAAAYQLLEHGQILNNNGERVEQSSSLLHVLLLALSQLVSGIYLPNLGVLFSLATAIGCLPLYLRLSQSLTITQPLLALAALLGSISFSYWSMGGLEGTLAALLYLAWVWQTSAVLFIKQSGLKAYVSIFIINIAIMMVRPESFAVLICSYITLATALAFNQTTLAKAHTYTRLCAQVSLMLIALCMVLVWRYSYFQAWLPQPVSAKASGVSLHHLLQGLVYFPYSAQLSICIAAIIAAIIGLGFLFQRRKLDHTNGTVLSCTSISLSYLAFIIISGGDWMLGGRFFTPILPLLFLLVFWLFSSMPSNRWKSITAISFVLLVYVEALFFKSAISTAVPNYKIHNIESKLASQDIKLSGFGWSEKLNAVHILDILFLNELKPLVREIIQNKAESNTPVILSSIQMGMSPFHLKKAFAEQVSFIDLRGLSNTIISDCAAFDSAARVSTGIFVSHNRYLNAVDEAPECQLKKPDVIYDLLNLSDKYNAQTLRSVQKHDYQIIWLQRGGITHGLELGRIGADAFIAVRNDIFVKLSDAYKKTKEQTFLLSF